jgi:hypothetical protein
LVDVDPQLVLVGGGYLWRYAPGQLRNVGRFTAGVKETTVRRELEADSSSPSS